MRGTKANYLLQLQKDGAPVISIIQTGTIHNRKDGSVYVIGGDKKRHTLTPCPPVADPYWPYAHTLTVNKITK